MATKRTAAKKAKRLVGRPRLEFDLKQIEQLAAIQCTDGEIAAVLACSRQTILNRKDDDPDFLAAIKRGRESGKASLRRLQWRAANAGNTTMLVWLGKQYLEQRDRQQVAHSSEGGVLVVPGLIKAEDWNAAAAEQQEQARRHHRHRLPASR